MNVSMTLRYNLDKLLKFVERETALSVKTECRRDHSLVYIFCSTVHLCACVPLLISTKNQQIQQLTSEL